MLNATHINGEATAEPVWMASARHIPGLSRIPDCCAARQRLCIFPSTAAFTFDAQHVGRAVTRHERNVGWLYPHCNPMPLMLRTLACPRPLYNNVQGTLLQIPYHHSFFSLFPVLFSFPFSFPPLSYSRDHVCNADVFGDGHPTGVSDPR